MSAETGNAFDAMFRDYLVFASLVSTGVLQMGASIGGARGLWIVPHQKATRVLATMLIAAGILYFIFGPLWIEGPWEAGSVHNNTSEGREWGRASLAKISDARALNDIHGGLDGNDQALIYVISMALAFIVSAVAGSIQMRINKRHHVYSSATKNVEGLDALAHTDYLEALALSTVRMKRRLRSDIRSMMLSSPSWSFLKIVERIRQSRRI